MHFCLGKSQKLLGTCWEGRVGSLTNLKNIVFDQESMNQMQRLGTCIVMMDLCQVLIAHRYCRLHRTFTKAKDDFRVVLFGHVLAMSDYPKTVDDVTVVLFS